MVVAKSMTRGAKPLGRRIAAAGTAAFAAALIATLNATGANAKDVKVGTVYSVTLSGIPIAKANLSLILRGQAYSARVNFRTSGIARLAVASHSQISAAGWWSRRGVSPARYDMQSRTGKRLFHIKMGLEKGTVTSLSARPRLKKLPDRIPVRPADRRHVLDPLSAALMPVSASRATVGRAACNRTLRVFDGWTRFNIKLHYKGTKTVSTRGYKGPVTVCGARWVPVAGHRPRKKSVRFMQQNKGLEAWLAPVGKLPVLVPFRISIDTKAGTIVLTASHMKMVGADFASSN